MSCLNTVKLSKLEVFNDESIKPHGLLTMCGGAMTTTRQQLPPLHTNATKLSSSDIASSDTFGNTLALSADGRYLAVGAPSKATNVGAVYVFVDGVQSQKLTSGDADVAETFGASLAMSADGRWLAIGATGDDVGGTNSGSVYVYMRTSQTFALVQQLQSSDLSAGDVFGTSVSLNAVGTVLAIGATGQDTGASNAGAVYVFTRSGSTFSQQQKLQQSGVNASDAFGVSVSLSADGKWLAVGASLDESSTTDSGTVSVFSFSATTLTWSLSSTLQAASRSANNTFGYSVSMSADGMMLAVGEPNTTNGTCTVFTRASGSWASMQVLTASDAASGDKFGYSVAMSADASLLVVSAREKSSGNGAVYVFARSRSSWVQCNKLFANTDGTADAHTNDYFGTAVAISQNGDVIVAGSPALSAGGGCYVYEPELMRTLRPQVTSSTSSSQSVANSTDVYIMTGSLANSSYTITLPTAKFDGRVCRLVICSPHGSGSTIVVSPSPTGYSSSSYGSHTTLTFMYVASTDTWYKL